MKKQAELCGAYDRVSGGDEYAPFQCERKAGHKGWHQVRVAGDFLLRWAPRADDFPVYAPPDPNDLTPHVWSAALWDVVDAPSVLASMIDRSFEDGMKVGNVIAIQGVSHG